MKIPPDATSIAISLALKDIAMMNERMLNAVAEKGQSVGFALLVFREGDPKTHGQPAQYISNVPRENMIIALEEVLARWKAGHVKGPAHDPGPTRN